MKVVKYDTMEFVGDKVHLLRGKKVLKVMSTRKCVEGFLHLIALNWDKEYIKQKDDSN